MSDIVERLRRILDDAEEKAIRSIADGGDGGLFIVLGQTLTEAAAEIERLRKERPKYCTVDGCPGRFKMLPLPAPPEEK